jgi:2-iminobutanoate/2-iminopropanoate deaminase
MVCHYKKMLSEVVTFVGMEKKIITSKNAPAPIGPYNQAVAFGNLLFISGQIPLDPISGELVQGSIKIETMQVMQNLKAILDEAGMDFSNVLKQAFS